MAAPLRRAAGARRFLLKSESQQYIRLTDDGMLRNDAGKYEATCFDVLNPQSGLLKFSTMINNVKYSLAMDSNGEVSAISDDEADSVSESGSGQPAVEYYDTFDLIRCPFRSTNGNLRGRCLKNTLANVGDCFLNFNSSNVPAKHCSSSPAPKPYFKALDFDLC